MPHRRSSFLQHVFLFSLVAATLFWGGLSEALAQTLPGNAPPTPTPKSMSEKERRELTSGGNAQVLGLTAELHGYPTPLHVLSYAGELNLTDDQAKALLASRKRTQATAKKIGADIVEKERELDEAFASATITPDELTRLTTDIGVLRGRLRAAYLYAPMEIKAILTPEQLALYSRLRQEALGGPSSLE